MVNEQTISNNIVYGYIGGFSYLAYIIIMLIVFIINTFKMYQDFYTVDRKSLKVQKKPELTPSYTAIAVQTQAVIIFFIIADIFQSTTYVFATTLTSCDVLQTAAGICYQFATTFMYLLLLTRLYFNYAKSKSPVSLNKIIIYSMIIVIYNFIIILIMATTWKSDNPYPYDHIDEYPNYCKATLEPITATMITIQEIVVTVAFLYVFYAELKRCVIGKEASDVIYAGRQLFTLSAISMISTSVLVIITTITRMTFFVGADPVINVICLVLMEPYYTWEVYHFWCCCCRFVLGKCLCCDKLILQPDDKPPKFNVNNDLMLAVSINTQNDHDVEMDVDVKDVDVDVDVDADADADADVNKQ